MSVHVVTGAFGYSGRQITARLLAEGPMARTLTNSPRRPHPFCDKVVVAPFSFDDPEKLVAALEGAEVLYNTYWVCFNHRRFKHSSDLGMRYASEMARRKKRDSSYGG